VGYLTKNTPLAKTDELGRLDAHFCIIEFYWRILNRTLSTNGRLLYTALHDSGNLELLLSSTSTFDSIHQVDAFGASMLDFVLARSGP
jgi:hypothetical protein